MSNPHEGWLHRRRHAATLARWEGVETGTEAIGPAARRRLMAEARDLRGRLNASLHALDRRSAGPERELPPLPPRTDAAWRLPALTDQLEVAHSVGAQSPIRPGPGLALFHDAVEAAILLRQSPAPVAGRHHLDIEVFQFDGSFLSLVIDLPGLLTEGLDDGYLVGAMLDLVQEDPGRVFLRLNLQHGPNIAQLVTDSAGERATAAGAMEFDLADVAFDGRKVDRVWIDLIPERPGMNRISIRECVLTRRPRAQF
jgi:hypothetical protein